MKRLLFIGGDLNGQLLPMHDGTEFESPATGARYRLKPPQPSVRPFPAMVVEGSSAKAWEVVASMDRFFVEQARRQDVGDV